MSTTTTTTTTPPRLISAVTVYSLLSTLLLLLTAYLASRRLLPHRTTTKLRALYIWHLFDALIHLTLEAAFLYNCFFSSTAIPAFASAAAAASLPLPPPAIGDFTVAHKDALTAPGVFFLGDASRLHGSVYGANPPARLWQEYAKADRRWGGSDLTIVSLELLTVGVGGPLALYVADLIRRGAGAEGGFGGRGSARLWFWGSVLATGELYGGFMTFAPEWLSKSPNLDTSNWMYTWLYLFFFNTLWVWFPAWFLYEACGNISAAFAGVQGRAEEGKKDA